jgi:hypothetical protein
MIVLRVHVDYIVSTSNQSFKYTSRSNVFAPNLLCLSVSILFAELKHDSEETVDTGTVNISRAIMTRVGFAVSFLFQ